jgi:hypothetical protein
MRSQPYFDKSGVVETCVETFEVCETSKVCAQVYLPGDLCISLSIGCGVIWARCITAPLAIQ